MDIDVLEKYLNIKNGKLKYKNNHIVYIII